MHLKRRILLGMMNVQRGNTPDKSGHRREINTWMGACVRVVHGDRATIQAPTAPANGATIFSADQ